MRDGVWHATGEPWQKGVCIVQFNRSCPAGNAQVSLIDPRRVERGRHFRIILDEPPSRTFTLASDIAGPKRYS